MRAQRAWEATWTCANGRTRRSARGLADDVLGRLVVAQAEEARLAQAPGAGPLLEGDLGDESRLRPVGARHARLDRVGERAGRALERAQPGDEVVERRAAEARPDLAGIAERPVGVVDADEQGAEAGARAARLGPAADDELLLGQA